MSSVAGTTLDKFQDIVEPFKAVSFYSPYIYLAVLLIVVIMLYVIYRYRINILWYRLKKIERGCLRGGSPRASLQSIYLLLQEFVIMPGELGREIERLCYGVAVPTSEELTSFLITLKPRLVTLKKCKSASTKGKVING